MTTTAGEASLASQALEAFAAGRQFANARLAYRVARNIRKLAAETKEYRDGVQAIYRKHAKKAESGEPALTEEGHLQFDPEVVEEANAEIAKLAAEPLEVDLHVIPTEWLDGESGITAELFLRAAIIFSDPDSDG